MNNTVINATKPCDVPWDRCFGTAEEPGKTFHLAFRTKTGKQRRPKIGDLGTFTARGLLAAAAVAGGAADVVTGMLLPAPKAAAK